MTRTPALAFWNSSATASLIGKTVLEPSRVTTEDDVELDDPPPQAASDTTAAIVRSRGAAGARMR